LFDSNPSRSKIHYFCVESCLCYEVFILYILYSSITQYKFVGNTHNIWQQKYIANACKGFKPRDYNISELIKNETSTHLKNVLYQTFSFVSILKWNTSDQFLIYNFLRTWKKPVVTRREYNAKNWRMKETTQKTLKNIKKHSGPWKAFERVAGINGYLLTKGRK